MLHTKWLALTALILSTATAFGQEAFQCRRESSCLGGMQGRVIDCETILAETKF